MTFNADLPIHTSAMKLPSLRRGNSKSWYGLLPGIEQRPKEAMKQKQSLRPASEPSTPEPEPASTPVYPPQFGSTYARVLTETFNCTFSPPMDDAQALVPLALYIEHVVRTADLVFAVAAASLVILQRLYTRLPPDAFGRRAGYSPHLLFAGAYALAAKQYIHMTEYAAKKADGKDPEDCKQPNRLSNSYWARVTGYSRPEISGMQGNIAYNIGRNIVVFPEGEPSIHKHLKSLHSYPIQRNLPLRHDSTLRNLSRMTSEDIHEYFMNGGRTPGYLPSTPIIHSLLSSKFIENLEYSLL